MIVILGRTALQALPQPKVATALQTKAVAGGGPSAAGLSKSPPKTAQAKLHSQPKNPQGKVVLAPGKGKGVALQGKGQPKGKAVAKGGPKGVAPVRFQHTNIHMCK